MDHPFERLLVDTAVSPDPNAVSWINPRLTLGETRKVITGIPGKTGVVYTLTVGQNLINDIEGATGAVTVNPEVVFSGLGQEILSWPGWLGGKDWEGGIALYRLAARFQLAPGTDQLGTVRAISAETGKTAWLHEQRSGTMPLAATGGGLVFGGDVNGRFRAHDHETGEVLWEINLRSPVTGFPITYAVDGRQYVAVSTGSASRFIGLTPEIRPSSGNNLFVFALPE